MQPRSWFVWGAVLAAMSVANGAFAAHGLEVRLAQMHEDDPEKAFSRLENFRTAAQYQMYHAGGLMLLGLVAARRSTPLWALAGFGFIAGIFIFSGMLYMLVLFDQPKLGAIVPIGGVSFIIGWLALAAGAFGALRE